MSSMEDSRRAQQKPNAAALEVELLGETPATPFGYRVRISRVAFDRGTRVRFALYQHDTFVRHLDLSEDLAKGLKPILAKL